jgi:hypothetical protein
MISVSHPERVASLRLKSARTSLTGSWRQEREMTLYERHAGMNFAMSFMTSGVGKNRDSWHRRLGNDILVG